MPKQDTPKSQSEKFIDKARELGVDESEEAFDEKLGRIVRQRPKRKQEKDEGYENSSGE